MKDYKLKGNVLYLYKKTRNSIFNTLYNSNLKTGKDLYLSANYKQRSFSDEKCRQNVTSYSHTK